VKFSDIKQLTGDGNYQVGVELKYAVTRIKEWEEDDYYALKLNPDFQRGHVWTEEQQIAYMEYLLMGGNNARTIYFNKPSWGDFRARSGYDEFVCVDGLQRLTAVRKYCSGT